MDSLDFDVGSVSAFSLYAISAARKYVDLVEAQISKAQTDMRLSGCTLNEGELFRINEGMGGSRPD